MAKPVKPFYPGADARAIEIPRQLINPPETPSGTHPKQKKPLSPVESTNTLQPNRPAREEASRINRPLAAPVNIPVSAVSNINTKYSPAKENRVTYAAPILNSIQKGTPNKSSANKKIKAIKKPR